MIAEMAPQKRQAYDLLLRQYERLGSQWHEAEDRKLDLAEERRELDQLWELAGFGTPPTFRSSRPTVSLEQMAS